MSMEAGLDLAAIEWLTGGKLGTHDVACPLCGPAKRKPVNQRRRVFRIWHLDAGFASFHCARCGERGYARDGSAGRVVDQAAVERAKNAAAERERTTSAERLSLARWLWSKRRPIAGSIAEIYLRDARGYTGPLPATLGFLPASGDHGPAMIAAFGIPREPEPGVLQIADDDVRGSHITRLAANGSGKAGTDTDADITDKIMIARSAGWPIVVAPPNDLLGIAVTEGIEDALSAHQATGLGAWAAGSASRLPALADKVPNYIECVTIYAHADADGQAGARKLADALFARGFEVRTEGLVP
jgi:hypothetical protein